jgi:hypothetical protein
VTGDLPQNVPITPIGRSTSTPRGEGKAMKSLLKSAKHAKYVLGSLSAVMFAVGAGNGF